jgi:hypothetical protein
MNKITFKKLWKYGVLSGIIVGLISLIPIIGGWDKYVVQFNLKHYALPPHERVMISLFFWVIGGAFMCWLIIKFTFSHRMYNKIRFDKITIFIIGGLFTTIAIQLAARDALIFDMSVIKEKGGGPLGEPSFETIGNFFASGFIYIGIYDLFLRHENLKSFFKTDYLSTLTLAIMSYGAVFIIWSSLNKIYTIPEKWGGKAYIFDGSFPHRERIILLPIIISVLFIIYYFGIRYETKKYIQPCQILKDNQYDLAISFAGEDRKVAEAIADKLTNLNYTVYYDKYEQSNLWGKDLYAHFIEVYGKSAKFCLMIISTNYANKSWTSHERKAAQAKAFTQNEDYILPLRLDETEIPGLNITVGYVNYYETGLEKTITLLKEKLSN